MRPNTLLLVAIILAACLGCSTRHDQKGKVVLTYTRWGEPDEIQSTRELIEQFQRENPDIDVRLDAVTWQQYWQKIKTAAVTGTAQDVWLMSAPYMEQYVSGGYLLDLTPFVNADPAFHEDDYFPRALDPYCYAGEGENIRQGRFGQGKLYAFTRDYNCSVLYYNRDHFDAIGLAYPTENWTWDDLVAAAKKLTIDFDGDGVIDQWGYGGLNYAEFAGRIGGVGLDVARHKSTFTDPLILKSLTFCHDLMYRYKVHPPPVVHLDETESFLTGKVSMTVAGTWNLRSFNRADFRWDIAPVPVDEKGRQPRGGGGGEANCIYSRTRHPNEAWRLVKFLSGESGQRVQARSGTSIPALKKAAFSEDFLAPFAQPPKSSYHVIFDNYKVEPAPPNYCRGYQEYTRKITEELDNVWRNVHTPEEACKIIDRQTDAILDEQYRRPGS